MSVNPSPAAPAAPPTPAAGAPTPSSMSLPGKIPRTTYLLFAIVCVGTSLGSLTQTALNTMAAEVLADLGTDIGWGQWLTTAYIFSMGVAVPLASYLQRKFSVRTLLLGAFSLYLAGSLCDFLALNFPMLIVGRVLEAVATGILMPLVQTIAMTRFPENRHGTAMGIAGIALGFAPNIGPTVGGMLIGAVGWRFLFLVLSAASALLLVATFAIVRGREARQPAARLEVRSLVLAAAGFGGRGELRAREPLRLGARGGGRRVLGAVHSAAAPRGAPAHEPGYLRVPHVPRELRHAAVFVRVLFGDDAHHPAVRYRGGRAHHA